MPISFVMAVVGKPPRDFVVTGAPEEFERWIANFKNYLNVVEISATLTESQKHSLLLNCLGEEAAKTVSGLTYDRNKDPYTNLVNALEAYYIPKCNVTYERYRFRSLSQESKIMPFVNELHNIAKNCDFENDTVDSVYNQNLRDQFILGLKSSELRRRLLAEKNLTLDKAIHVAVAFETSMEEAEEIKSKTLQNSTQGSGILAVGSRNESPSRSKSPQSSRKRVHFRKSPSARNESNSFVCYYCRKPGHLRKNCFKLQNDQKVKPKRTSTLFHCVEDKTHCPLKEIQCDFYDAPLRGIVDTGATVSLISQDFINRAGLQSGVIKVSHQAIMPDGQLLNLVKGISGPLFINDVRVEAFFYVSASIPCDCLIGMNLLQQFGSIRINKDGPDLVLGLLPSSLTEFSDVFDKPLSEACYVESPDPIVPLSSDAKPFQCKVRQFSPRDKQICEEQVQKLLAEGVIEKSKSPWRHSPVVVPKRSGGFRMAVDYRPVNSVTEMDAYPIPNVQELLMRLEGCKIFSSLDFSQFYYQLPLHSDDREKTAFYAAGELYQFKRCPFGLKNAVSYCTRVMRDIFRDMSGVSVYLDDILIHAKNENEHDKILREVMLRIRENCLSLNMSKCSFYQRSVSFLGHRITDGKICPDPDRTKAISQFPTPKTGKELQRFLGMCNHFRNYIRNFASLSKSLYLLSREKQLCWTDDALKAFNALKDAISKSVLVLPSSDEQMLLYTDASHDCVGACLVSKTGQPISFASKKLTPTETRWSTIDKEAYAVVWAMQKLRPFLLGRHFSVLSDHQPLKYLLQAKNVNAKVHRWRIMVAEFDFDVQYIPGNQNVVADSLSRIFSLAEVDAHGEVCIEKHDFLEAQKRDPEFRTLFEAVRRKFSSKPSSVSHDLWSLRKDLSIKNSFLCYKNKLLVPARMRSKLLTACHYGHQGIENVLNKLSSDYFWPKMRHSAREFVKNCRICSMVKPSFVNADLKPYLLDAPMQLVVSDYIGPLPSDHGYRYILVIMDAFSRFPETYPVRDMSAKTLISKFRDFFARYGFPDAILSDNGTQYRSREFLDYLSNFHVKKLFTNVYRPSSNGLCERFNGTLQKKLQCLLLEKKLQNSCWTQVLPTATMAMRNDHNATTGFTPCELFLAFRVKDLSLTLVNARYTSIRPFRTAAQRMAARRHKANSRRRTRNRRFERGAEVVVRSPRTSKLSLPGRPATVVDQADNYTITVDIDGVVKNESTARVSPLPKPTPTSPVFSPRPVRTKKLPSRFDDYELYASFDKGEM